MAKLECLLHLNLKLITPLNPSLINITINITINTEFEFRHVKYNVIMIHLLNMDGFRQLPRCEVNISANCILVSMLLWNMFSASKLQQVLSS